MVEVHATAILIADDRAQLWEVQQRKHQVVSYLCSRVTVAAFAKVFQAYISNQTVRYSMHVQYIYVYYVYICTVVCIYLNLM